MKRQTDIEKILQSKTFQINTKDPIEDSDAQTILEEVLKQTKALKQLTQPIRLLIVDHKKINIVNTAIALAGYPGINIECLYYPTTKQKKEILQLAKKIIEKKPNIVFIDTDPISLYWQNIIKEINKKHKNIKFIANASIQPINLFDIYSAEHFHNISIYGNFKKGMSFFGFNEAIIDFLMNITNNK
jgi:hypothetical protein